MAQIFLSYVRPDKARAAALVKRLRQAGFDLWWDDDIQPGDPWEESIETELALAQAVIVCWSPRAVASENVRAEARRAKTQGKLIQVFLEDCELPLFFGERQGVELPGNIEQRDHPGVKRLIARLHDLLDGKGGADSPPTAEEHPLVAPGTPASPGLSRRVVLAGSGGVLALALGAGGWMVWKGGGAKAARSVAVLPFANLSGDAAQGYFSDGLAEELRGALARLPGLTVIGRTSSEKLRNDDAVDAASKLGVAHILTGSVRRSESMIRVSAQLIDGASGAESWTHSYDSAPGDTLSIQSKVAEQVAQALSITLGVGDKAALTAGGTTNAGAHDLVLKGAAAFKASGKKEDVQQALASADAAIALDPNYAEAYVLRANACMMIGGFYVPDAASSRQKFEEALAAASHAIQLAPNLIDGYSALARAYASQLRVGRALDMFRRGSAHGENADFLTNYGETIAEAGQLDKGMALVKRAIQLDPLNPQPYGVAGWLYYLARNNQAALDAAHAALRLNPARFQSRLTIVSALMELGRLNEAQAELAKTPMETPAQLAFETVLYIRQGKRAAANEALKRLLVMGADAAFYQYAEVYAQFGQKDQAIAALERAFVERDPGLGYMRGDPWLDPLRSDPRFKALDKKLLAL